MGDHQLVVLGSGTCSPIRSFSMSGDDSFFWKLPVPSYLMFSSSTHPCWIYHPYFKISILISPIGILRLFPSSLKGPKAKEPECILKSSIAWHLWILQLRKRLGGDQPSPTEGLLSEKRLYLSCISWWTCVSRKEVSTQNKEWRDKTWSAYKALCCPPFT